MDINKLNFELDNHMHVIGFPTCEVHYTRIKPRIIAEELLHDNSGISSSLIDYKIWCFNGHPTFCFVCYDRHTGEDNCNHATFDAYSLDNWKTMRHLLSPSMQNQNFKDIPCPFNIDKMIEISKRLSEGFPEVRIDLYNINGRIYFGEMTFTSAGGEMYYFSKQALKDLGHQIILPSIHKKFKVYE